MPQDNAPETTFSPIPPSTVDSLEARRDADAKQAAISKELQADFKKALNDVATTPNGEFVLKMLIRLLGVFQPDSSPNPSAIFENAVKRNIYLRYIRPLLDPQTRSNLESGELK